MLEFFRDIPKKKCEDNLPSGILTKVHMTYTFSFGNVHGSLHWVPWYAEMPAAEDPWEKGDADTPLGLLDYLILHKYNQQISISLLLCHVY